MKSRYVIEELSKIPQIYCSVINHSRDKVAFYWDKSGILELYVVDLKTEKAKQVSHGECPREIAGEHHQIAWLYNDRSLVFAGRRNHNLFKLDIETGEIEQIVDAPKEEIFPIGSTPDDKYIIVLFTRAGPANVFKVNIKTKETLQLTKHRNPVDMCTVNPKTGLIAYTTNETDNPLNMDIWLIEADGIGQRRALCVKEGSQDYVSSWSNDGKLLAFATDANGVEQVGVYDVMTGEWNLFGEAKYEEGYPIFTANDRKIVALRNHAARMFPVLYDLETGNYETLEFPIGVARDPHSALDDRLLVFRLSTPRSPSHLVASFNGRKPETLVAPFDGQIDQSLFVEPIYITYRSFDGLEIPAILYEPPTKGKYPALIEVHHGPWWQHFLYFNIFAQAFVSNGYVLLQPNIRGSTGYGKQFREMNVHDWGGGDLEDVVYGAFYLKTLPNVDEKRIGILGRRYGGYITLMALMKKPELWNAGCAISGITHPRTLYERSSPQSKCWLKVMMGDPEENRELWEERSPLNYAQNLDCPLLMVHPVNDSSCPVEESRQLRSKLIELGRKEGEDFEYIELGEGSHAYSDPGARLRYIRLIIDFFERRLKTYSYGSREVIS